MHLDYVFPECIGYGSGGGPEFMSQAHEADNGDRSVFIPWPIGRHRYDAQSGVKTLEEYESVLWLAHVAQGVAHSFDWKDWSDYKSCPLNNTPSNVDQDLGTGDGVETDFPIYKDYVIATVTRRRPIQRPVIGSIMIAGNGTPITSGWAWIPNEFLIRFDTPPAGGVDLTCGYLFYVPVAFESNYFNNNIRNKSGLGDGDFLCEYPIGVEEVKLKAEDIV